MSIKKKNDLVTLLLEFKEKDTRSEQWIQCEEHVPDDKLYYIVYSEVFCHYYIACYNVVGGWHDAGGDMITYVTHWNTRTIHMPWLNSGATNYDAARKYGYCK